MQQLLIGFDGFHRPGGFSVALNLRSQETVGIAPSRSCLRASAGLVQQFEGSGDALFGFAISVRALSCSMVVPCVASPYAERRL